MSYGRWAIATFLALSFTAFSSNASTNTQRTPYSVLQGPTSASETQFTIVGPAYIDLQAHVVSKLTGLRTDFSKKKNLVNDFTRQKILQVYFEGLKLEENYELVVTSKDQVVNRRNFKMLDTNQLDPRVALLSCMSDHNESMYTQMWGKVSKVNADVVFFLGDNVYAGLLSQAPLWQIWRRYSQTWYRLPFYHQKDLKPVFATWDDHDTGGNDVDSRSGLIEAARNVFNTYYPRFPIKGVFEPGPGVSSSFKAFGRQFVFLDDRSFRIENGQLLGDEQWSWLENKLQEETASTWLINGIQFMAAGDTKESIEGAHAADFRRLINTISRLPQRVSFISGDRHHSEIMVDRNLLPYPLYEYTSSGLHSWMWPFSRLPANPRRIQGIKDNSFILMRFKPEVRSNGTLYEIHSQSYRNAILGEI